MGKVLQIEVPDWIDLDDTELRKILVEALERKMKDKVDINVYRMYLALKYPETKSRSFDLDRELEILKDMRKKEKKRVIE